MRWDDVAGRKGFPLSSRTIRTLWGQSLAHSKWVKEKLTQQLCPERTHCLQGYHVAWGWRGRGGRKGRWLEDVYLGCEAVALRMY